MSLEYLSKHKHLFDASFKLSLIIATLLLLTLLMPMVTKFWQKNSPGNNYTYSDPGLQSQSAIPSIEASELVSAVNNLRTKHGLREFQTSPTLNRSAFITADEMISSKNLYLPESRHLYNLATAEFPVHDWTHRFTYSHLSVASVINWLHQKEINSAFLYSESYQNIGIGVKRGRVYGQGTNLIVIYLANPLKKDSTLASNKAVATRDRSSLSDGSPRPMPTEIAEASPLVGTVDNLPVARQTQCLAGACLSGLPPVGPPISLTLGLGQ